MKSATEACATGTTSFESGSVSARVVVWPYVLPRLATVATASSKNNVETVATLVAGSRVAEYTAGYVGCGAAGPVVPGADALIRNCPRSMEMASVPPYGAAARCSCSA